MHTVVVVKTSPAQSNLGRAALQSPHWLQWDAQNSTPLTITTPSNTPIPQPTPLTMASGSIQPCCYSTVSGQTD